MNITVTVTASPELLAVLQTFADVKVGAVTTTKKNGVVKQMAKVAETAAAPVTDPDHEPVLTPPASETAEQSLSEPDRKAVSIEEIRIEVQAKSQAGKREKIKNLLGEFGVKNVSSLAPDQYGSFYSKVAAI